MFRIRDMIEHTSPFAAPVGRSEAMTLLPIMAAVFVAYLVIGVAMPVLPRHVPQGLGRDSLVVGLAAAPVAWRLRRTPARPGRSEHA